ncbi:histidine kinase [uncultured Formosa sp.]|uniref:tetratricopeptide repeat-containing sensor histidine kinase n=1 Tax=uncultured Formosa sp. TaxID=255435 RepID=UPI002601A6B7|nr:histidine kinase [uncultured Formosa sp.]
MVFNIESTDGSSFQCIQKLPPYSFKQLCITCLLSLLPYISQCATHIAGNNTNKPQDSIKINFNQKIADAENDNIKLTEAYFEYGKHLKASGNSKKAIIQFEKALEIAQSSNNNEKLATIANYTGNTYVSIGDFTASNKIYLLALKASKKTANSGETAKISMNLASNYNYIGDYEKATKYGLYALKVKETTHNLERICYHYIAMGNIFRENDNVVKWEEYVRKAYKMKDVKDCASISDIAKIYNSLGGLAVRKEKLEQALMYYDTLMVLSKKANYKQGINTALTNSAGVYKQLNNFSKALELSTEAEQYFGENPYESIFNKNFKAELYNLTEQYKKGLSLVNENIQKEEINYYSTEKLKTLELLYQLNYNLKNYEKAFFWNDSLRSTETLLRDQHIRESFEELETKYETEKKEQQIEILTTENKLKNQRINAGIAIVSFLTISIFLILYILNIRKKQAILKQNDLQQQVLRTQMNPHFMFNVLGSIQNFMMQNDTRKASNFLSQFATLTRATLNNSTAETISLADEMNMIKNYIELEKMRKQNKFDYTIEYDNDLEVDFIQIPPMLIQPFIENSIKHGFKNVNKGGLLKISITDKIHWIEFVIEDNGEGLTNKTDKQNSHKSMAMSIFEKRRKLIQQKYKTDFKFEILNLKDKYPKQSGVRITISIPILNND